MVKSMFAAVAGLRAHQAKMDVIGNNIANVNTYGYKTARATFRDVFYATSSGAGDAGEVYGGTNPMQLGYGSIVASVDSIMTGGGVAATDKPMDTMIVGNGFFMVGPKTSETAGPGIYDSIEVGVKEDPTAGGGGGGAGGAATLQPGEINQDKVKALSLTRVGNFNFDGDGNLVDSEGRLVYGFPAEYTVDPNAGGTATNAKYEIKRNKLAPLRLPNNNQANQGTGVGGATATNYEPMPLANITIGKDGTIMGTSEGKVITIGQIGIANVPNPEALERQERSYYKAKANTGVITANPAGQNSTGTVQSGVLEMSNVDLSREFTDMITTQRGFQANTRIITVTDQMLEEMVNMKR